jgi:hypothetical protein
MTGFDWWALVKIPLELSLADWLIVAACIGVFLMLFRLSVWHVLIFSVLYGVAMYSDFMQVHLKMGISLLTWKLVALILPAVLGLALTYRWVHQVGFVSSVLVNPYLAVLISATVVYFLLGALALSVLAESAFWQTSLLVPFFTQFIDQF